MPQVTVTRRMHFNAAHRVHNPALSEQENQRLFGKCNNPNWHGHNYELQVTLTGQPQDGTIIDIPAFERIVADTVIDRFDHKNLNLEVAEFKEVIPSVENIAKVIYGLLRQKFESNRAQLASVTVWESSKTWCEYSED
jgi:6-pyruvoyltetrahydropterin/6-carboxytetrahydropterin synthase